MVGDSRSCRSGGKEGTIDNIGPYRKVQIEEVIINDNVIVEVTAMNSMLSQNVKTRTWKKDRAGHRSGPGKTCITSADGRDNSRHGFMNLTGHDINIAIAGAEGVGMEAEGENGRRKVGDNVM